MEGGPKEEGGHRWEGGSPGGVPKVRLQSGGWAPGVHMRPREGRAAWLCARWETKESFDYVSRSNVSGGCRHIPTQA